MFSNHIPHCECIADKEVKRMDEPLNIDDRIKHFLRSIISLLLLSGMLFMSSCSDIWNASGGYPESEERSYYENLEKSRIADLEDENSRLNSLLSEAEDELQRWKYESFDYEEYYEEARETVDWFTKNIAFVVDDDHYYYHSYTCDSFENCNTFWAYNVEAARAKGYHPHEACCHSFD